MAREVRIRKAGIPGFFTSALRAYSDMTIGDRVKCGVCGR
jgi:hypothetical protein